MNRILLSSLIGLLSLAAASVAQATVIVTYAEAPGAVRSSFINATTFDFNNLALGLNKNVVWKDVGKFDKLYILKADQYGGADNTKYSVQGVNSSVSKTILNLDTPSNYFGLWWSAGDASNVLEFYSGANGTGDLLARFTTGNLLKVLPDEYDGNPNAGPFYEKDGGEPFAFLNFFATPGNAWASVVFSNSSSSGFEADNIASRVAVYDSTVDGPMPGVVFEAINGTHETLIQTPEPKTTLAAIFLGMATIGAPFIRRMKQAQLA